MPRRKSKSMRRRRSKKGKKVSFVTSDGRRVSFTPKPKRKGSTPAHLKPYARRMKQLSKEYNAGEFGNMSWNAVVSKYMSSGKKRKRSKSRRRRF